MAAANADSFLKGSMGTKGASISGNTGEKKYRSRSRYGNEIEKLQAGDFFGHKALSQRDEAALCSSFVDEPLELLAVKADVFTEIFLQSFQEDFRLKAEFLSNIEFFSGWSPHLIRQLIFTLKEKKYHPGDCVFRQDIPTHCLHIVKSGSIKLSTHGSRKPPDEVIQKIEPEWDFLGEILAEGKPSHPNEQQIASISKVSLVSGVSKVSLVSGVQLIKESQSTLNVQALATRRRSSFTPATLLKVAKSNLKQNENNKKEFKMPVHLLGFKLPAPSPETTIEICNIGPGEFLGDIEAMCDLKHHLFNAVCMTTTVVYEVDLFHIEQLLHKRAPRTLYCILQYIVQKVEAWHSRHKSIQFFKPLTTVLNQVEKRLTTEGANKPIRRQHNYDACTLALMATRSLGKPILSANTAAIRNCKSTAPGHSSDLNCRPFSALYGCARSSSPITTGDALQRRHSIATNLFTNRVQSSSSSMLPEPELPVVPNSSSGFDSLRHCFGKTSKTMPRPIKARKFSFDSPPPRLYHIKPNLISTRFPIPPPSPYPIDEDQRPAGLFRQNPKNDYLEGDEMIETIRLARESPPPNKRQRCKSANVRQVSAKPELPFRPKSASPLSIRGTPTISSNINTPLQLPSPILPNMESNDEEDILQHDFSLPAVENIQGDSPKVTTMPIVIPIATKSEGDLTENACDVVSQSTTEEETYPKEIDRVYDSSAKQEDRAGIEEASLSEVVTDFNHNGLASSNGFHVHKQVRISDKLQFHAPNSQLNPTYPPEDVAMVPMAAIDIQPGKISIEHKPQDSQSANDTSQLDDLVTETTIPKEYMKLQRKSTEVKPPNSTSTHDTDTMTDEEVCRCNSTMPAQKGVDQGRSCTPLAYKCVPVTFAASSMHQTR